MIQMWNSKQTCVPLKPSVIRLRNKFASTPETSSSSSSSPLFQYFPLQSRIRFPACVVLPHIPEVAILFTQNLISQPRHTKPCSKLLVINSSSWKDRWWIPWRGCSWPARIPLAPPRTAPQTWWLQDSPASPSPPNKRTNDRNLKTLICKPSLVPERIASPNGLR